VAGSDEKKLSYKPPAALTEISGDESGTVGVWADVVKGCDLKRGYKADGSDKDQLESFPVEPEKTSVTISMSRA